LANGGEWVSLGTYSFTTAGGLVTITASSDLAPDGRIVSTCADAVRFIGVGGNYAPDGTIDSPVDNVTINIGESINFAGSGSDLDNNLPLTYHWNFGDKAIADAAVENPGLIQFNTPGIYAVTFTVIDALGMADSTPAIMVVTVNNTGNNIVPNGIIDTPVDSQTIAIGESIDFSATGTDPDNDQPLTYLWNFGDPDIPDSVLENPGLVQFNTAGTYIVTFTVTDGLSMPDLTPDVRYVYVLDAFDDDLIPQSGWSLHNDPSQAVGRPATNAFDGDPGTKWFTEVSDDASHPHEIQINLGKFYDINGFRYLPKQDGGINGRIDQYKFYVSRDGVNWGNPVAQGTFINSPTEKEIRFPVVVGKYIRLVALSEVNNLPYTSVAELNLLGGTFSGNLPPKSSINTPVANLTIGIGDSVSFTGTGSDSTTLPLTYLWTFGDPTIPSAKMEDPGSIQFDTVGMYIVTFNVMDSLGRANARPVTRVINVEVNSSDFLIPQENFSLQYVDSEESEGADGAASNAFDGNVTTIWHTEWSASDPPPPHEIQIDLGSAYEIYGLHYLPRQDGELDGTITEYEVYISSNGTDWDAPVATGTFPGDNNEKQIVFAPTPGQFIALVALHSVDNEPWTSAAEINVKGRCDTPYLKILQPENYALSPSADLSITTSVCLNETQHNGWGVKFTLDGGSEHIDYSEPYSITYEDAAKTEHTVEAVIVDDDGHDVIGSTTQDQVIQVGIGDYYVAIGDSITTGFLDDIPDDDSSQDGRNIEGGFTPVLNDLLTGEKGYPHTVAMEGIPGYTSSQGLAFLPTVLSRHPDSQYFLVLYGTNDAGGMFPVTPATFKANLQQMIDMIRSTGKEAYLAKVPYSKDAGLNSIYRDYNAMIDELVSENSITVEPPDFYTYFETNPDELVDDWHPDGNGYQSMADLWQAALQ
jgi:lysophospholipase L1-like esterase/chitodextrinase